MVLRLASLVLLVSLLFGGCVLDDCRKKRCYNGGVCIDGDCDCPPAFMGANCEKEACGPCYNGGWCSGGPCDCPSGYTGEHCEIRICDTIPCFYGDCELDSCHCWDHYEGDACESEVRAKFIGDYLMSGTVECGSTETTWVDSSLHITPAALGVKWIMLDIGPYDTLYGANTNYSTYFHGNTVLDSVLHTAMGNLEDGVLILNILGDQCDYQLIGPKL